VDGRTGVIAAVDRPFGTFPEHPSHKLQAALGTQQIAADHDGDDGWQVLLFGDGGDLLFGKVAHVDTVPECKHSGNPQIIACEFRPRRQTKVPANLFGVPGEIETLAGAREIPGEIAQKIRVDRDRLNFEHPAG
jgi:hypothetical protein